MKKEAGPGDEEEEDEEEESEEDKDKEEDKEEDKEDKEDTERPKRAQKRKAPVVDLLAEDEDEVRVCFEKGKGRGGTGKDGEKGGGWAEEQKVGKETMYTHTYTLHCQNRITVCQNRQNRQNCRNSCRK